MKRKLMSLACVAVIGFGITGSASAAEFEPTSGSVTFSEKQLRDTTVNVGGGKWTHGSGPVGSTTPPIVKKYCKSHYNHSKNRHSATAAVGSYVDKKVRDAGINAPAYITGPYGFTAKANWSNNA